MSDFLRRLATRAVADDPPVRPLVPSPYGGADAPEVVERQLEVPLAARPARRDAETLRTGKAGDPAPQAPREQIPAASPPPAAHARSSSERSPAAPVAGEARSEREASPAVESAAPARPAAARADLSWAAAASAEPPSQGPPATEGAPAGALAARPRLAGNWRERPSPGAGPAAEPERPRAVDDPQRAGLPRPPARIAVEVPATSEQRERAPSLPPAARPRNARPPVEPDGEVTAPAPRPAPARAAPPAAAEPPSTQSEPGDTLSVSVTIGRVEVAPPVVAAPPERAQPRPERRAPRFTLDDYLREREALR